MKTQEVWKKYSNDLKQFIISKVKNPSIADDILQDSFIKIHTKLHTLKDLNKLRPWIFSITRNSILDYFKSKKMNMNLKTEEEVFEIDEYQHTEKDCLRGILSGLPKKYRDPIFLSDIKGMKQSEVAQHLNQNLATTKSQIQRARRLIAQGFMDCCGLTKNENGVLVGEIQDKENCKICN